MQLLLESLRRGVIDSAGVAEPMARDESVQPVLRHDFDSGPGQFVHQLLAHLFQGTFPAAEVLHRKNDYAVTSLPGELPLGTCLDVRAPCA